MSSPPGDVAAILARPRIRSPFGTRWYVETPEGSSCGYRWWKEALAAVHHWYAHGELPPLKHLFWGDAVPRSECVVNGCSYCTFTTIDAYNRQHEARNPGHYVVTRAEKT